MKSSKYYKVHHPWDTDLFRTHNRLGGLTVKHEVARPTHVQMSGHVNLKHRGICVGPVGWGLFVGMRKAASEQGLDSAPLTRVVGAKPTGNIASIEEHYKDATLDGYAYLSEPGWYRFEVWGCSHSSAAPNTDGLIEVNAEGFYENGVWQPSNQLIVRFEEE